MRMYKNRKTNGGRKMGLMDGHYEMAYSKRGNNNNYNQNQNQNQSTGLAQALKKGNGNNKKPDRSRKIGEKSNYSFGKSSYMPNGFEDDDNEQQQNNDQIRKQIENLGSFIQDFYDNVDNYQELKGIIQDDLPEVVSVMTYYYTKYNSKKQLQIMNDFVKLIGTSNFAKVFAKIFESRIWLEDCTWDNMWQAVAFSLSIALETNHERMNSDVVRKYVRDILPRIWGPEIENITKQCGVTKDLALDLLIAIPLIGEKYWNNASIEALYSRFLDKMLIHADDNMDVLNWEIQGRLFQTFFGSSSVAKKVIGKYMSTMDIPESGETVKDAVYKEFIKMIYSKLDRYDIKDITFVLSYVASSIKRLDEAGQDIKHLVFSFDRCKRFTNIMKGISCTIEENPDMGKYLAN